MAPEVHLIFDLGGTLIFDPFEEAVSRFSRAPLRQKLKSGLFPEAIDNFIERWKIENTEFNFSFASHFLQEEVWITRAAWPAFEAGKIVSKEAFATWTTYVLKAYRLVALDIIANQPHLSQLRYALQAAKERGYVLSVASNDRYFATSAMLSAAKILNFFDYVVTSEGLSFTTSGAEKPSRAFFETLQQKTGLSFETSSTFYIGDDETRDILSTKELPIKSVRYFGNLSASKVWLDNSADTQADLCYANYAEFASLIINNAFEK